MGKIIYLPLEHIESRYTTHMDRDISNYLDNLDRECIKVYPDIPVPTSMKACSWKNCPLLWRYA